MQKYGRRVRVSLPFLHYTEKRYRGKSRYFSWRRRRDSTGFQPVVFALRTVYFMSLFAPQKDGRRVRVSPNKFIYTKRKSTKEKSLCFFWRRRRDSTGFQPVVFALRTVYFMSLFAPQKDGRRVRVSPNKFIYTKRKSTKEKSLCFFCEDRTIEMFLRFRCLDLNSCKLFHSMLLALKASTIGLIFIFPIFNEEA